MMSPTNQSHYIITASYIAVSMHIYSLTLVTQSVNMVLFQKIISLTHLTIEDTHLVNDLHSVPIQK